MEAADQSSFVVEDRPRPEASPDFTTTRWSVVLRAGQEDAVVAGAALEQLCKRYWYPIYAFIRRRGATPPEAEDLTQAFFAHVLEKEALKKVDRQKGKFRTFLLAAATNFLANEWDRRQTLKRGGGRTIVSFDDTTAEDFYRREPVESVTPEKLFERRPHFQQNKVNDERITTPKVALALTADSCP